jgi:hypothetical protein
MAVSVNVDVCGGTEVYGRVEWDRLNQCWWLILSAGDGYARMAVSRVHEKQIRDLAEVLLEGAKKIHEESCLDDYEEPLRGRIVEC